MDTTEETHDGEMPSLSFQIVRGVIAGALIVYAAWLIGNVALNWLGAPFLK